MKLNNLLKPALPHIYAIVFFIVITLVYFNPVLNGNAIKQDDIIRFKGMSKELVDYREKTGEEALWTNSMFGGMPAYQISVLYHGNLIRYFNDILTLGLPHPVGIVFLYLLGFYFLLVTLRINPWLCVAGAIAFAFSSYLFIIIQAGHNSKAYAIAYMAPVIAGILITYRGKYLLGAAVTALALALEITANHPQITYYLMLAVLILGIVKAVYAVKEKKIKEFIKPTLILIAVSILAVLTNITSLLSTYEYGKETIRGKSELTIESKGNQTSGLDKDYATAWSYGKWETMTLLIPNFMGGSSYGELSERSETFQLIKQGGNIEYAKSVIKQMPLYWGPQPFTSGPTYIGAIVIFLFILGLFIIEGEFKWWLLSATILSIMLAWGKNFMTVTDFFLEYFPLYNKFRAVSMILVIAEFTMPLLAIIVLNKILNETYDRDKVFKALKSSLYIVGGVALLFIVLPGAFFSFTSTGDERLQDVLLKALISDRESLLRMDSFRSLIFIILTAGVIWAVMFNKIKKNYAYIIIIALILFDMWSVDQRYLNNDKMNGKYMHWVKKKQSETPYQASQADLLILQDTDPNFRVFNLTSRLDQDAETPYFHKSIGGYHGAKLRRYQDIISYHLVKNNLKVINMLNTKYIIRPNKDNTQVEAIRNPEALGNAWFVDEYKLVANADSELMALNSFDPAKTLIVDKRFSNELEGFVPTKDSNSYIKLTTYKPNHLIYESEAKKEQLAVFSEIYYKDGWNAYIDGQLKPHFRADYILRAMRIPSGKHKIEFKFEPKTYYIGEKISLASSAILILIFLGIISKEIIAMIKNKE